MKKTIAIACIGLLIFSCGPAEKEIAEPQEEKDSLADYVTEEIGTDPADMPCGMKDFKDSATVTYHGSKLKIQIAFDCPGEGQHLIADETEASLQNQHNKENILRISLESKKFDTSFVMYKKYFLDSLGSDFLKESVFGSTWFDHLEGKEDFIFTTFIGRAYSDDGMVVKFSLHRKKGIRVLSTAYPEMGEEEVVQ